MKTNTQVINIPIIEIDADALQLRAALNHKTVKDYAERMAEGDEFPAIELYKQGNRYVTLDGLHRLEATRAIGKTEVEAVVRKGEWEDAVRYALAANAKHGLRRTNADKQQSARLAVDTWPDYSDRQLAEIVAVHHSTIGAVRAKPTGEVSQLNEGKRKGKDGKSRKMPRPSGVKKPSTPAIDALPPSTAHAHPDFPAIRESGARAEKTTSPGAARTFKMNEPEETESDPKATEADRPSTDSATVVNHERVSLNPALASKLRTGLNDVSAAESNLGRALTMVASKLTADESEAFRRVHYFLKEALAKLGSCALSDSGKISCSALAAPDTRPTEKSI